MMPIREARFVPWIIDYSTVIEQMREQRFKSLYYNSGAFGFPPETDTQIVGWLGGDDPTIKPDARAATVALAEPYEENLSGALVRTWEAHLPGRVWIMPMSHWSYELEFGSREWMPALLERIGIDPGLLTTRNNGAAIEFAPDEPQVLAPFVQRLLQMLIGSDFMIAFPRRPVLCTLHHHKQLWWQTSDAALYEKLRNVPANQP
jgi:hypothetical protein